MVVHKPVINPVSGAHVENQRPNSRSLRVVDAEIATLNPFEPYFNQTLDFPVLPIKPLGKRFLPSAVSWISKTRGKASIYVHLCKV